MEESYFKVGLVNPLYFLSWVHICAWSSITIFFSSVNCLYSYTKNKSLPAKLSRTVKKFELSSTLHSCGLKLSCVLKSHRPHLINSHALSKSLNSGQFSHLFGLKLSCNIMCSYPLSSTLMTCAWKSVNSRWLSFLLGAGSNTEPHDSKSCRELKISPSFGLYFSLERSRRVCICSSVVRIDKKSNSCSPWASNPLPFSCSLDVFGLSSTLILPGLR